MHIATTLDAGAAKSMTDDYLASYCKERIEQAEAIGPSYVRLWQAIEQLLQAGGKRFRPYMLLSTYQTYAPEAPLEDILPAALAQELLHVAMLIHDDIIDRDTVRYGVANVEGQYSAFYRSIIDDDDERSHMAVSAAILAGDALLSDAHKLIRKTLRPIEAVDRAGDILDQAVFDVIGGELMDTESGYLPAGAVKASVVAKHKTASYSFVSPLTMGAVLAGAPEHDIDTLRRFGEQIGIGYQYRDDLLGTFGDESLTGKSISTDLREGKRTFLIEAFEQLASEDQKAAFFAIFHMADASNADLAEARRLLTVSGARQSVENTIEDIRRHAAAALYELSLDDSAKAPFNELVDRCLAREV